MSMTDPISDFLTRIRNGIRARKPEVACPRSKLKVRIAEILREEGYVDAVTNYDDRRQGVISVTLRYDNKNTCAITGLKRVSKPASAATSPRRRCRRSATGSASPSSPPRVG